MEVQVDVELSSSSPKAGAQSCGGSICKWQIVIEGDLAKSTYVTDSECHQTETIRVLLQVV